MAAKPSTTTINGDDRGDRNGSSYQDTNVYDNEGNILPHLFGLRVDDTFQHLDMGAIKKNSYSKTREAMAVSESSGHSLKKLELIRHFNP